MKQRILAVMMTLLVLLGICCGTAAAVPEFNQWSGSGPFATGLGNRVITALAVSPDNMTVYSGTGSGTLFSYTVTPPSVTTAAASGVTTTGATLNGTVNDNALNSTVVFEYGTNTAYGTSVAATPVTVTAGSGATAVSASLTGLTPGATYHFRVVATSSSGTSNGGDQSFIAHQTPAITTTASATFTYGIANSFSVTTNGYPAPALSRSGILPLGVNFHDNGDGSAAISGTANASGTFPITITATNSAGHVDQSFTLTVTAAGGTVSAVSTKISVSPDRHLFGVETLNSCGTNTPVTFTVRNNGSSLLTLGTLSFGGPDAAQFDFGTSSCNLAALAAAATCTVEVKFCPTTTGSKSATLLIPSDAPDTPTLAALLYNHESTAQEAARRMPSVLESLDIPTVMNAGETHTITWSLLGYEEDYLSRIVFFDCSGLAAGTCGNSFANYFADSGNIAAESSESGDWNYSGVTSKRFEYSYSFTAPTVAADTDIVIRFYRKSAGDDAAGKGSLSLLIPGNVIQTGTSYYDLDGRRLKYTITVP